jgi:hypothetical protein
MGQTPITNKNVLIPANTVSHLLEKRVVGDGLSNNNVVKDLNNAIYGSNSRISRQLSNTPGREEIQAFINVSENPYSVGFTRNHSGQPEVTSAFKMREREALKKFPDIVGENISSTGTPGPQNTQLGGSQGRFTGLLNNNIIDTSRPEVKRALKKLESTVGRERLQEMLSENRPLLDQGGTTINDLARQARDVSPQAAEKLVSALESKQLETPSMVRRKIDEIFGDKNTIQNAEDLAKRLDPEANAMYEQAFMGTTIQSEL